MRDWTGLLTDTDKANLDALSVDWNERIEGDLRNLNMIGFNKRSNGTLGNLAALASADQDAILGTKEAVAALPQPWPVTEAAVQP